MCKLFKNFSTDAIYTRDLLTMNEISLNILYTHTFKSRC
jgi:hypothetical protein